MAITSTWLTKDNSIASKKKLKKRNYSSRPTKKEKHSVNSKGWEDGFYCLLFYSIGELALLYNAPRAATIIAKTDSILFSLDRQTFNHIVKVKLTQDERDERLNWNVFFAFRMLQPKSERHMRLSSLKWRFCTTWFPTRDSKLQMPCTPTSSKRAPILSRR